MMRHNELADIPQLARPERTLSVREQDRRWIAIGAAIGTAVVAAIYGLALWRLA